MKNLHILEIGYQFVSQQLQLCTTILRTQVKHILGIGYQLVLHQLQLSLKLKKNLRILGIGFVFVKKIEKSENLQDGVSKAD